jgi:hypothetical protein
MAGTRLVRHTTALRIITPRRPLTPIEVSITVHVFIVPVRLRLVRVAQD